MDKNMTMSGQSQLSAFHLALLGDKGSYKTATVAPGLNLSLLIMLMPFVLGRSCLIRKGVTFNSVLNGETGSIPCYDLSLSLRC